MVDEKKFCKDCKSFVLSFTEIGEELLDRCSRFTEDDLVWGISIPRDAYELRLPDGECGEEALFFEEK